MKFYFTFGFGQEHQNGFHIIESDDSMKARKLMVKRFGIKWSMQYDEDEWMIDGKSQEDIYHLHRVV